MLLTLLEVAFLLTAVVGLGLWSVPLALVVGGVLGAAACEWAGRGAGSGGGPQPPAAPQNGPQGPRSVP